MLKAVIFDMDGVIIESEPLHRRAYFAMFDEIGISVSPELYDSLTGKSTQNVCKQLVEHFELSNSINDLITSKRKHFEFIWETDPSFDLISGVRDLILNYYSNGLTLVLASSASHTTINKTFDRFNLNPYFKAKLSGADLEFSKPHPEIFNRAVEASGFSREECMVIEDATNGVEAAKAAGVFCTAFDSLHSKNQDYSKADLVVSSFEEIHFELISDRFSI